MWFYNNIWKPAVEFILSNMGGFITSGSIAIAGYLFKRISNYVRIRKSDISGWWEQLIYENDDDAYEKSVVKRDYYRLKHTKTRYSGNLIINIKGKIRRAEPESERKWDVLGYLDGDILTMIYQSGKQSQKSRGCIYVKLIPDDEFRGFYLEEHEDGVIDKTPLVIRKVKGKKAIRKAKSLFSCCLLRR